MDHLLHVLLYHLIPHYALCIARQDAGFEGPDLEVATWLKVTRLADTISESAIQQSDNYLDVFQVQSSSDPALFYEVDLEAYTCSCPSFLRLGISFCKHICAVQNHFNEEINPQQLDMINTDPKLPRSTVVDYNLPGEATGAESRNNICLGSMILDLQRLVGYLTHLPPLELMESLMRLKPALEAALQEFTPSQINSRS